MTNNKGKADEIQKLADQFGDKVVPFVAGKDGIHPLNYKKLSQDIQQQLNPVDTGKQLNIDSTNNYVTPAVPRSTPVINNIHKSEKHENSNIRRLFHSKKPLPAFDDTFLALLGGHKQHALA